MNLPFYAPLIAGPRIFNLPQLLLLFHLHLAGCPSGQRELTVNQPSSTSWVQIPHPPLITARILTIRAVFVSLPAAFSMPWSAVSVASSLPHCPPLPGLRRASLIRPGRRWRKVPDQQRWKSAGVILVTISGSNFTSNLTIPTHPN